jgi:peptidoglycan/xylan/chitin deacetylase (PgdA/CDA1 family)
MASIESTEALSGRRADVLVLCYHAVSETWPADLSVTPAALARQLEMLTKRGYIGITFSAAALGETRSKRAVAVTFDDGYASTLRLAAPILKRFGIPGTLFVPTDYIGGGPMQWPGIEHWRGGEHDGELLPLSWDEVRELADAGWEVGSHTRSHPRLSQLGDEQLADELAGSRKVCEEMLDRPCRSIAYPYGDHDDRVVVATDAAGYLAAGTFPSSLTKPTPLRWPRVGVFHDDGIGVFRAKISPAGRMLRRSPLWKTAVEPLARLRRRG